MSDTNVLRFSLRERGWLSTFRFVKDSPREPGQTLLITADPMGALMQYDDAQATAYASSLAFTLSRFRDFRYVGTKLSVVPVATTAQVDPAHVAQSDTVDPSLNFVHPRDIGNMIHWRRWVGGNISLPHVHPTGGSNVYVPTDSYNLDAAWLSDVRFNHAPVSDGFSIYTVPLRASAEMPAYFTNSVFAYYDAGSIAPTGPAAADKQMRGQTALTGGQIVKDSWGPNPFAGFTYSIVGRNDIAEHVDPSNFLFHIDGMNPHFPWFGDMIELPASVNVNQVSNWIRQRYLSPICILRLPPAYGTRYFWTLYMRHYYEVRRPYLTNGTWLAGKVIPYQPTLNSPAPGDIMLLEPQDEVQLVQMIAPDPYGAADSLAQLRCECGPCSVPDPFAPVEQDMVSEFDAELDAFDANHGCGVAPQQEPEDVKDISQSP